MRVELRRDVKIDNKTKLFKTTKGLLVGVNWGDGENDKYIVEIDGNIYKIDKKDADVYG